MKNWKYIEGAKTGNAGITDKEFNSENEMRRWCIEHNYTYTPVGGGYYRLEDDSGKNRKDLEAHVKAGNKTGNDTLVQYVTSKPKAVNEDKTGAEEFFKKLAHDVDEREKKDDADIEKVGNETYQHKLYPDKYVIIEGKNYKIITDGKVEKTGVLTDAVLYGINQTYKKVGNLQYHKVGKISIRLEANDDDWTVYDADGNELKSGKGGLGQAKTWAEHFARFTNKRTGNVKDKNDRDLKVGDIVDVRGKKGKITKIIGDVIEVFYDNRGTYNPDRTDRHYADEATKVGNIKNLDRNTGTIDWDVANFNGQWYITKNGQKLKGPFPSMKEAERYLDGHKWELQDKYGNAKTGNKKLKFTSKTDGKIEYVYDEESQDGFIYDDGKLVDTIKGAGQGWLNLIKQKAFSSGVLNKTGNAIGGGVQSETVLTEAKDGSQYWVEKTSKSGQYAQYNLYYTIGQGKRHAGVFKDKEAAADAGRRIIGNASSNEEYWKKQYIETARKKGISEKEIQEFVKKIEKEGPKGVMSTVKNSAQDDKFAYVMREFDAGKLKTPDGKVVTDPAQAKAIAYSESKKTENGLARARKAMNKRCGNSQVTLWKGNDSVLISEDGTVQYLESNSFETDRDKYGSMQEAIDDLTKKGYRKK